MTLTAARPTVARPRVRRWGPAFAIALAVLAVLALLSLMVGSSTLPVATAWHALTRYDATDDAQLVIHTLRLPRTGLAVVVGAALGAAGCLMQAITRNPLADPGVLGVNAGAAAAVVTAIAVFGLTTPGSYLGFALLGSAIAAALVLGLGGGIRVGLRGGSAVRLVLAGTAVSVVLGSFTSAITINYPEVFDVFRFWVVGALQGRGMSVLVAVTPIVAAGLVLAWSLSGSLNALALGADTGAALGASVGRTWALSGIAIVLLAGGATAGAGPVAFIGLAAPHVARLLTGPDHRRLVPMSALLGANLLLAADVVGRLVARPSEVQAGIVAAVVGAPVFIWLVRRRRMVAL